MMDYKYIRAWGRLLGSLPSFVEVQVEKARAMKAPETAVYLRADGTWETFEGVQNETTKARVMAIIQKTEEEK